MAHLHRRSVGPYKGLHAQTRRWSSKHWKAATIKAVAQEAKNKSAETILLISRRTYDKVNKSISYALPFACSNFVIPFNFLILPIVKGTHIALSGSRHEHYSSIQKTT